MLANELSRASVSFVWPPKASSNEISLATVLDNCGAAGAALPLEGAPNASSNENGFAGVGNAAGAADAGAGADI